MTQSSLHLMVSRCKNCRFLAFLLTFVTFHVTFSARMICTFKHEGLKTLFETGHSRSVAPDLHRRLIRQLDFLNCAKSDLDMNLQSYRFHQLQGTRRGTYGVTVSGNRRLTFTFTDAGAHDIDLEDYH